MYQVLLVSVVLAGLTLPLNARNAVVLVPNAQQADGQCSRLVSECIGDCGPVDQNSHNSCVDKCVRVNICDTESHRLSRSNLPDDDLPASSLPDSRLPDDKLPDSRLP